MPDEVEFPVIDEPEEEEEPVTPETAPARIVSPRPPKPPGRHKAARGAGFAGPPGPGAPPGDPRAKRSWEAKEADFMWSEMVAELRRIGAMPYDMDARVIRMDPPPQYTMPGAINGNAMAGSEAETPGDMLVRIIDDNFHMPAMRTAATYDIMFMWKSNGQIWGRGRLGRPAPDEIQAIRMASRRNQQSPPPPPAPYPQAPAPFPPQGNYGAPSTAAYAPYGYPPPQGYGAPYQPQQVAPASDPARDQLIQHLIAQNQAMFEWAKQQGMAPPAGFAAPPTPPVVQPVYVPQPAPAAPAATGLGADFANLDAAVNFMERIRHTSGRLNNALGLTVVDPRSAPTTVDEPNEPAAPEKPEDHLSFHVIPIPESTLKYAQDKETGDIDWKNTGFVNLDSEIGKKIVGLASDFVQGIVKAAGVKQDGSVLPTGLGQGAPPQLHGSNGTANSSGTGWRP